MLVEGWGLQYLTLCLEKALLRKNSSGRPEGNEETSLQIEKPQSRSMFGVFQNLSGAQYDGKRMNQGRSKARSVQRTS